MSSRRARSLSPPRREGPSRRSSSVPSPNARQDDADDSWIFDNALTETLTQHAEDGQTGGGPPLLDFELRQAGPRRNWRNVLERQSYQAILRHRRDPSATDDVGQQLVNALRRTIRNQIAADTTLTRTSTVHFTLHPRFSIHDLYRGGI